MNGPHCPKCEMQTNWEWYAGPEENPDALRCESLMTGGAVCGYIHWRRNAPASEPTSKEAQTAGAAEYERRVAEYERQRVLADRRDRVRALVHSLCAGGYDVYLAGYLETVALAERMDSEIEALTNIQGRDL